MFNFFKKLFSGAREPSQQMPDANHWSLRVSGEITALKQINIDKSGRNARYVIYGTIVATEFDLEGAEFVVPGEINFQGTEKEIEKQAKKALVIGEKVTLHFAGTETPKGRYAIANL
jgi:hypothetical protein